MFKQKFREHSSMFICTFWVFSVFLIYIILSGGTVDVTTVKINADSSMEHLQSSGGGPWGGNAVNEKFFTMIRELVGDRVFDEFCSKCPQEEYDLRLEFEGKKREVRVFKFRFPKTLKLDNLIKQ